MGTKNTLPVYTLESINNLEHVHGPVPCSSRQSTVEHETLSGAALNGTDDHISRMHCQAVPGSGGSHYPHRRLQEVGQENTMAVQCTSPRNSYHGNSTYTASGSPSHTHSNIVMISQGPPMNVSAVNLGHSESSDGIIALHSSPIEATPDNGHPSYLTGPQHFLATGTNPHPDDVWRTHQRREGRANQQDFRQLVEYSQANGEPNNDVSQVERQILDDSENNRS